MCYYSQENPDNSYATNVSLKLSTLNFAGIFSKIYVKFNESPTEEDYLYKYDIGTNEQQYYRMGPLLKTGRYYFGMKCVSDHKETIKFRMEGKKF